MSKKHEITILHLSDLQFGKNHRFGRLGDTQDPNEPFDSLFARLATDLDILKKNPGLMPDLIAVTGDIAEWGKKKEFEDALLFLTKLAEHLKLPLERILVVPGNHDINRDLCESYFKECAGNDEKPLPPYFKKWECYVKALFEKLYKDTPQYTFNENAPWSWFEISDLKLVVAGLNSTMKESHKEDHYGFVGEAQLQWFKEKLETYEEKGWFRLGLAHHNPFHGAPDDAENLRDKDDLDRILGQTLHLLLHGHRHQAKLNWLNPKLPVLATGSTGVKESERPPIVSNQYQIIRLSTDRLWFGGRAYCPTQKRWIGDTSVSKTGNQWFMEERVSFEHAHAAPGLDATSDMTAAEDDRDSMHLRFRERKEDTFLNAVLEVHTLRQQKSGCDIQCRIVEAPQPVSLYAEITKTENQCAVVESYALCAAEDITESFVRCVADQVHEKFRRRDPGAMSYVVGRNVSDAVNRQQAMENRIRVMSYAECQGLIDFDAYLRDQTARLSSDPIYPPELYVPQRMEYQIGRDIHKSDNALAELTQWIQDPMGRFLFVLGHFGTGKTFLMREIARRMGEEKNPVTPLLIEMRRLEKAHEIYDLLALHLAQAGLERIDIPALRYMIKQGRIVLLFDGFDELALRLPYGKAADHLDTVLQALDGDAKVVVTSRPEHFESDNQILNALGKKVAGLQQKRIVRLQPFNSDQILQFLVNLHNGDEEKAKERFHLLDDVKDLLGLSAVPRMLCLIADIPDEELIRIRDRKGEISAASVYRLLVERWIAFEVDRYHPHGAEPGLTQDKLFSAVEDAALMIWPRAERTLRASELPEAAARAVDSLESPRRPDRQVVAHQVGSSSLLVRDKEGYFSFVHQSMLEWLTAAKAAKSQGASRKRHHRSAGHERHVRTHDHIFYR